LLVAAPLGVAALVVLLTANIPSQTTLMQDGDLDAASIEMDHNAMLANDPSKNAAFLKAFSGYLPSGQQQSAQLQSAKGTTQLAQQSHDNHRSMSAGAESRLNAKLAASMQSQLTASSQGDELMTPHFVAALDAASHMAAKQQMLASSPAVARQEERKQVMDAMTMSEKGAKTHLLPPALRQKYAFSKTKSKLGSTQVVTPAELSGSNDGMISLRQQAQPNPTGGPSGDAAKADNSFLAASQSQEPAMTAKQLIQQAALAQMNQLQSNALASASAPAPAPQQQLAAQPPMQQQPMQPQPRGMYSPGMQELAQQNGAPPQPAPTQQMYQQPAYQYPQQAYQYPQQEQAPTQQMYQQPQQPANYGYGYSQPAQPQMYAPAQTQMTYEQPAVQQYEQPQQQPYQQQQQQQQPPSMYEAQQQALSQDSGPLSEAPAAAVGGSSGGVPPNWRAPDAALKQGGSVIGMSASNKAKVKQQMMALRSQIESDFKHNTKLGDTALLLGPGGL